jgi:predicted membrane chloride channel (bestrophin family)
MFYLFFLPLALCGSGMMGAGATLLTTAASAYAMLGLDEISFLLEQPFRLMPLFQLCKNSMMDVADTAAVRVPPLGGGGEAGGAGAAAPAAAEAPIPPPAYW